MNAMTKQWETKRKILKLLSTKTKTVTDISEELNLSHSTVSQHLQELLDIGAVREIDDRQRKWKYYEPNPAFDQSSYQETFLQRNRFAIPLAVLAALVAIAALYYVHATAAPLPFCTGQSNIACSNVQQTSSGYLSASIGGFAQEVHIFGVGCSFNSSAPTVYAQTNLSVAPGQFARLNITCPQVLSRPAAFTSLHVWIAYIINDSYKETEAAVINFATNMPETISASVATTTVKPASSTIGTVATSQSTTSSTQTTSITAGTQTSMATSSLQSTTTIPSHSTGCSSPADAYPCLYVSLSNSQQVPTPAPFQQMVVLNASEYYGLEAPDLGNIRFVTESGAQLYSWCESGCNSSAHRAVFWVRLPGSIGARSTSTILLVFTPTDTEYDGVYAGEAPQLSPTYAEYDNGANVFLLYDNFEGPNISQVWSTAVQQSNENVLVSKGLTITPTRNNPSYFSIISSHTFSGPLSVDMLFDGYTNTGGSPTIGTQISTTSTPDTYAACGYVNGYGFGVSGYPNVEMQYAFNGGNVGITTASSPPNQIPTVFTETWLGTGSLQTAVNYSVDTNSNNSSIAQTNNLYVSVCIASLYYSGGGFYQWVRTRSAPPNGVMPSVSFSAGAQSTTVSSTTSTVASTTTTGFQTVSTTTTPASQYLWHGCGFFPVPCFYMYANNSQSVATPAPFQQMVTFNASQYASYETSDLGNIRFFNFSGAQQLYSWCESGCNSSAHRTVFWVRLPNGIPANSRVLFAMYFMSNSVGYNDGPYAGEAPQLSPTYGEYDNGWSVFSSYQNFNGTSLPPGWYSSGEGTGNPSGGYYECSYVRFNNGYLVQTVNGGIGICPGNQSISYLGSNIAINSQSTIDVQVSSLQASGEDWQAPFVASGSPSNFSPRSNDNAVEWQDEDAGCGAVNSAANLAITSGPGGSTAASLGQTFPQLILTVTTGTVYANYTSSVGGAISGGGYIALASESNDNDGLGYCGSQLTGYWIRTRGAPPNGVMPSISFLKPPATSSSITSSTTIVSETTTPSTTTTLPPPPSNGCSPLSNPTPYLIYINQNDTCGPFKVLLAGLSQPNVSGVSAAQLNVYFQKGLVTSTTIWPGPIGSSSSTEEFTVNGFTINVSVSSTTPGQIPSQEWAKIELNVTQAQVPSSSTTTTTPTCSVYGLSNVTASLTGLNNVTCTTQAPATCAVNGLPAVSASVAGLSNVACAVTSPSTCTISGLSHVGSTVSGLSNITCSFTAGGTSCTLQGLSAVGSSVMGLGAVGCTVT